MFLIYCNEHKKKFDKINPINTIGGYPVVKTSRARDYCREYIIV